MNCPEYVKNCIDMLERAGFSAYAVGGAVRDSLLGLEPSDWDVTTSARPEQTLEVFRELRTIPTGIKHGTVTVLFENGGKMSPIEITTFRIDGEYRDSRHPESVMFSDRICDDLSRRDFTVNAMAYSDKCGIVDVFGGRDDLENRLIRAVGDPEKRFSEDALRILRAFRFSAQLGFEIEENTLAGASKCAHLLKNIARERVGAELKKLLSCRACSYSLQKMMDGGVWKCVFNSLPPETDLLLRLGNIQSKSFEVRLSALIDHLSELEKEELLTNLRLSREERKRVIRLCSVKKFEFDNAENSDASARRFLHFYYDILEDATKMLAFWHGDEALQFVELVEKERALERALTISSLDIRGNDILPLCEGDYAIVGKTLDWLLKKVIENPCLNQKEILRKMAEEYIKKSSL